MPNPSIHSGVKLSEVVPGSLDHVSGVTSSTALVQRKRLRLVPQTAATANPSDIINFLIQDPGMLDLQSAVFHANIVVTGSNSGVCTMDDGPSWLRQLVVQVDGQNLETQDRVNKCTNMETYMTASSALYNRALSFAGYWKFNPDLKACPNSAGTANIWCDVSGNATAPSVFYANTTFGYDVAVPLGLVSHVFRSEKMFPSRFANNLLIQMQLESAAAALFTLGASTASNYQLTNIYLEVDSVTLNPAFTAFLQDAVMDANGAGLVLPFNTKISAQGQSQVNNGENTFVVSRASKNLRRVAVVQQPQAALGAAATTYPEISTFPSAGFNTRGQSGQTQGQIQLYIAGQYYPLFPCRGSAAYWVAHQAYNGHPLTDCDGGIVNYRTWGTTTDAATSVTNTGSSPFSDQWIWAYDLSKMIGSSDELANDGVDSTGNAQLQITIKSGPKENGTAAESYTPLVEMLGTKFLTLSNGELTIQG
jgi:hypothetical protein